MSGAALTQELTSEALLRMNRRELDALYAASGPGSIPQGDSRGTALATWPVAKFARFLWQGKVFDPATGTLINKVMGRRMFVAKVYPGESWFDGKPAIIVDYQGTSTVVGPIRDEIREVSPGLYLGMAYLRSKGRMRLIHFALDVTGREAKDVVTLNRVTAFVFGIVLVIAGILGFVLPPSASLMSGATYYNIFHIVFGVLAFKTAVLGRDPHARAFNIGFGLIDLYQAAASRMGLFPGAYFLWRPADDIVHVIFGVVLLAIGVFGKRK